MLEPVIIGSICVILAWGLWKTRAWEPPTPASGDVKPRQHDLEMMRETGKHTVRLDRLESELANIRSEWDNYRSSVDSIVRRGIRHKVLDAQAEEETVKEEVTTTRRPQSRSDLLKIGLRPGGNSA